MTLGDERIYVVMPVGNEESSIRDTVDGVLGQDLVDHLVVVIDHLSGDETVSELHRLSEHHGERLDLLFHESSNGVASCYLAGFKRALNRGADIVVEMDAGGSHDPRTIPQLLQAISDGSDCAFGSRFMKGGRITGFPLYRRALSKLGTRVANTITGTHFRDMTSGFEAFRSEVLRSLDLDGFLSKRHMFQTEMRYYCRNFDWVEIPIHYAGGDSTLTAGSVTEALRITFAMKRQPNAKLPAVRDS